MIFFSNKIQLPIVENFLLESFCFNEDLQIPQEKKINGINCSIWLEKQFKSLSDLFSLQ